MTDLIKDDYNTRVNVDVFFAKGFNESVTFSSGVSTSTVDVTDQDYNESIQQPELAGAVVGSDIEVLNVKDNGDSTVDVTVENETGGSETVDVVVQAIYLML